MNARIAAAILALVSLCCGPTDTVIRGRTPAGSIQAPPEGTPPVVAPAEVTPAVATAPAVSFVVTFSTQSPGRVLRGGDGGTLWVEVSNTTDSTLRDVVVGLTTQSPPQKLRFEEKFEMAEIQGRAKRFGVFSIFAEQGVPEQTIVFVVAVATKGGMRLADVQRFTVQTR